MYTFNVDTVISYELGSDEPTSLAEQNVNLFTSSADDILSRMGKVVKFQVADVVGVVVCVVI
jgi:hypothetical protein